jgi:hypothetical protein
MIIGTCEIAKLINRSPGAVRRAAGERRFGSAAYRTPGGWRFDWPRAGQAFRDNTDPSRLSAERITRDERERTSNTDADLEGFRARVLVACSGLEADDLRGLLELFEAGEQRWACPRADCHPLPAGWSDAALAQIFKRSSSANPSNKTGAHTS